MGYRKLHRKPKPEDMLPRLAVRNGATLKVAFDCFYFDPKPTHDPHYHDHIGWPAPNYHFGICQMLPPRNENPRRHFHPIMRTMDDVSPIDLGEEGYTGFEVAYEDEDIAEDLTTRIDIDDTEDVNVIRMQVDTALPSFSDKPKETRFTVFAAKEVTDDEDTILYTIKDELLHGILTILPGNPGGE